MIYASTEKNTKAREFAEKHFCGNFTYDVRSCLQAGLKDCTKNFIDKGNVHCIAPSIFFEHEDGSINAIVNVVDMKDIIKWQQ